MYIPGHFKEEDHEQLIAFMREYNFASLVSVSGAKPIATHLPFVIREENGKLFLVAHMAKANPQWETLSANEALVIFQGPHAYISPKHYEKQQNVPTWNYIAVHAYGNTRLISDSKELFALMETTIRSFESGFMSQWKDLSPSYVEGMLKAIVGFEIEVTKLEGKFKLSQNKTTTEQKNIIAELEDSKDPLKEGIASEMKKKLK
jgi:transcriptional regulator